MNGTTASTHRGCNRNAAPRRTPSVYIAILLGAFLLTACGGGGGGGGVPEETFSPTISVVPGSGSVPVVLTRIFMVRGNVSDQGSEWLTTDLSWSSNDEGIATVDATGTATGVSPGTATISVTHLISALKAVATLEVVSGGLAPEGDSVNPVDITGLLPFAGQVNQPSSSFYVLSGLNPDAAYTVSVIGLTGDITMALSNDQFATLRCSTNNAALADETCTIASNSSGEIHILVNGTTSVSGATYTILVTPGGVLNEGTSASPVDLTGQLPYPGTVNVSFSYYVVTGLTAGAAHTVHLTGITDDVMFTLYPDAFLTPACSSVIDTADLSCAAAANASGELYIAVYGGNTAAGATYTVDVVPGGIVNEGTSDDPVDLTGLTPYDGSVSVSYSYYVVTGLTAGNPYTVSVTNLSDNVELQLYPVSGFPGSDFDCVVNRVGTADEVCAVNANASGEIYIRVRGTFTAAGATYTLDVAPGGLVNEGNILDHIGLVEGSMPYDGTVNTWSSFYVVTGLTADANYTVTQTNRSDNTNFRLYSDAYSTTTCTSVDSGSDRICVAPANGAGEMYIRVFGNFTAAGATFTLDMAAGGYADEGSYSSPIDLTSLPGYSGQVWMNNSYYVLTGLTPGGAYTTTLTDLTANADLVVYSDQYSTMTCESYQSGTADETCLTQANGSGELFIQVTGTVTTSGAGFTLDVTAGG